jgi:hypothetical protein
MIATRKNLKDAGRHKQPLKAKATHAEEWLFSSALEFLPPATDLVFQDGILCAFRFSPKKNAARS